MESSRKKEGQRPQKEWKDSAQGEQLNCFNRELEMPKLGIVGML